MRSRTRIVKKIASKIVFGTKIISLLVAERLRFPKSTPMPG